ncbi:MAG: transporter substrate-binding domain-containing protein [Bacteroidia bacterium]|nr:transporter substrate-binding domain-containing protein [Bacteroidia bacterium]
MIRKTIILSVLLAAFITSCTKTPTPSNSISSLSFDLDSIIKRGKLIAVTDFNSTNYFLYKGEPMGFHYELLRKFSEYIGVDLEIITENHLEHAFSFLKTGEADLLAIGLTVSASRKKEILFTEPIYETRQVLIQRKPRNWRAMTEDAIDRHLIRNQLDLAGKNVYVQDNSIHLERLHTLADEIGDTINIIPVPYETEDLIKNVANGEIEFTVCDENVAKVNATYYPGIDVNTAVSFPQYIAWGVRKYNSDKLLGELNRWIASYTKTTDYALLYAKYFRNTRSSIIVKSDYYSLSTGKISKWDDLIKKASQDINWDWRLLASLICQESRFDPNVESWAGAYGLMQIMPATGKNFGIDITSSPGNNIKAGTKYIDRLQSIFEPLIPDENERMKFILASYNAGPGHVLDAMRLAKKNGMDPKKWDGNVALWLLKKSEPAYYNDIVVKNGYFRGTESVNFVSEVLTRYDQYKNIIPVADKHLALVSEE